MSCETVRENASIVDSSVTDWKHDMGNLVDPESSRYKVKKNAQDGHGDSRNYLEDSSANTNNKMSKTRYFIIKSLNHQNIQLSVQKGIWATQVMNEPILEDAFNNSGKVILIFSVNMSGFFQGYAQMISSVGWRRDNVWSQGSSGSNPWGRSFKVKWLQLCDLPFQKTLHLKNPLNDFKPVKISRDCQELPQDIGQALCELLDGQLDVDGELKRDDFPSKRPFIECSSSLPGEGHNMRAMHVPWTRTPAFYPSILFPCQDNASQLQLAHQRLSGPLHDNVSVSMIGSNVALSKNSHLSKNFKDKGEWDATSHSALWDFSRERSPITSSITEDEFLDMSYEEYLEVHSRNHKQFYYPAASPSSSAQELSTNKEHDTSYSHSSRKRAHSSQR